MSGKIKVDRDERPHMETLLATAGIGGVGGSARGWSALRLPCRCWRAAYYLLVKGLRAKRPSDALDTGVLYHACMEAHFTTGGRDTFKPLEAVEAQAPNIAWTVRRALNARMEKYSSEEARDWDVRAVEHEVVNYVEGTPTCGKYEGRRIKAPISSKYDLVIGKGRNGGAAAPAGPLPDGVWIFDHKTTGRLSKDKIRGFGMDAQLMLMALNWKLAGYDKVFGKLNGLVLEIVVTTKEIGVERLEIVVDDEDINRFQEFIVPWAIELESMLAWEKRDEDVNWPVNFGGCHTGYGVCTYWELCASHGRFDSEYTVFDNFVPARGLAKQEFEKPRRRRRPKVRPPVAPVADDGVEG